MSAEWKGSKVSEFVDVVGWIGADGWLLFAASCLGACRGPPNRASNCRKICQEVVRDKKLHSSVLSGQSLCVDLYLSLTLVALFATGPEGSLLIWRSLRCVAPNICSRERRSEVIRQATTHSARCKIRAKKNKLLKKKSYKQIEYIQ